MAHVTVFIVHQRLNVFDFVQELYQSRCSSSRTSDYRSDESNVGIGDEILKLTLRLITKQEESFARPLAAADQVTRRRMGE